MTLRAERRNSGDYSIKQVFTRLENILVSIRQLRFSKEQKTGVSYALCQDIRGKCVHGHAGCFLYVHTTVLP